MKEHLAIINEDLVYYFSLSPELRQSVDYETRLSLQLAQDYIRITRTAEETELKEQAEEFFTLYYQRYIQPTQEDF